MQRSEHLLTLAVNMNCYNCRHYILQMEGNGKKQKQVERCAAKGGAILEVAAVVNGSTAGLLSPAILAKLIEDKTDFYIFGSPARYLDASGEWRECPLYERNKK